MPSSKSSLEKSRKDKLLKSLEAHPEQREDPLIRNLRLRFQTLIDSGRLTPEEEKEMRHQLNQLSQK